MAKRNFLLPLGLSIAALLQSAHAAIVPTQTGSSPDVAPSNDANPDTHSQAVPGGSGNVFVGDGKDVFRFVLQRTENGELIAAHGSHSSHASHASHASHYSSR